MRGYLKNFFVLENKEDHAQAERKPSASWIGKWKWYGHPSHTCKPAANVGRSQLIPYCRSNAIEYPGNASEAMPS